jgi:hypothetical protein
MRRPERACGSIRVLQLSLNSTFRDFAAERYFTCEVGLELDIRVPLPDTFATVAHAHARRMIAWHAGGEVAVDSLLREIPLWLERLRPSGVSSPFRDSARIVLGGVLADTIGGTGGGGPEGRYDGGWSCATDIPLAISRELREHGYPAAELLHGEWHIFPVYGDD